MLCVRAPQLSFGDSPARRACLNRLRLCEQVGSTVTLKIKRCGIFGDSLIDVSLMRMDAVGDAAKAQQAVQKAKAEVHFSSPLSCSPPSVTVFDVFLRI